MRLDNKNLIPKPLPFFNQATKFNSKMLNIDSSNLKGQERSTSIVLRVFKCIVNCCEDNKYLTT